MRKMKFRAWNTQAKKMYFFDLKNKDTYAEMKHLNYMQSTGLRGANNVEIYEGDIISYRQKQPNGKGYIVRSKSRVIEWRVGRAWNGFNIGKGVPDSYVVLGNIYENPELVK